MHKTLYNNNSGCLKDFLWLIKELSEIYITNTNISLHFLWFEM